MLFCVRFLFFKLTKEMEVGGREEEFIWASAHLVNFLLVSRTVS